MSLDVTTILRFLYARMEYPGALLLIIPALIILYFLLPREFLSLKEELEVKEQKRKVRKLMYFTRTLMIILLAVALASPYIQEEKTIDGDPYIQLLVDNSTSMTIFEDISQPLAAALEKKLNTEVKIVGTSTSSNIGDAVLNNIKPHASVLLLSDGNVNTGASLGDVALYATKLNATINAIQLEPIKNDAAVTIIGPSKTLENSDTTFAAIINKVGSENKIHLTVTLDSQTIYDLDTSATTVPFTKQLTQGTHKITATINSNDYFPQNNVFYKTIRVVPEPKILLYSEKTSPLETLLKQLYVVDTAGSLPTNLKDYYAIVLNDIPADKANAVTDVLNDYTADGNGLVVFGGENSYDKGNYRNSNFEQLLPVLIGKPEKKPGDILIAVVIDISGSTGIPFGHYTSTADFEKSAAIGILHSLKLETRVAIIAFNNQAYLLSEPSPIFQKQGVDDLISRLKFGGGTQIGSGLLKAIGILNQYTGSKNIVLLSDGKTQGESSAIEAAKLASNTGIKIYTVGVGPSTNEKFMQDVAEITNGIYFRADDQSALNIIFGPVDEQKTPTGQMSLVILNKNHFITENFDGNATLYGYNQVSPKGAARLLATTSTGQPVLTVWRLGLGRVASYSVDDGSKWAGDLLSPKASKLIARTMNWAIGDPERKSLSFIDAKDTRLGDPAEITVRSNTPPHAEGVVFYKIDQDTYTGNIIPTTTGFQQVAGADFAVNYESEYENLGISHELEGIVKSTGGKMFSQKDIIGIIEHAKTRAKRIVNDRNYQRWPFIILAAILFILEIFIRRIVRRE